MIIGILRNEEPDSGQKWVIACQKKGIEYNVIDLTASNWFEEVKKSSIDYFLVRPPGKIDRFKNLFDERLYILSKVLKKTIFPSYEECFIYENKRLLSSYLCAKKLPHPDTWIFYNKSEAYRWLEKISLPVVAKTSIGASGSGVKILRKKTDVKKYIDDGFSKKGIKRRFGPNRVTGSPKKWIVKAINSPSYFMKKIKEYVLISASSQKGFVIFQEYIPHDFEWRGVRIGDSYFAHKKIKAGDKASGSKGIEYCSPSLKVMDFIKCVCDENNFNFMAIDFFENENGEFLINELQTIFGHVQDHILEVEGKAGRYRFLANQWIFEEGDFNTNESFDLRLEVALNLFGKNI